MVPLSFYALVYLLAEFCCVLQLAVMRLVLRLRTSLTSLSCRPLRDLCYTFVVVAVASALLTYHLSRHLPPSTRRQVHDDDRRAQLQRYRRRTGDRTDMGTGTGTSIDVRQVLEGLEARQDSAMNAEETSWNEHDDDFDRTDSEVSECYVLYNVDLCSARVVRTALLRNLDRWKLAVLSMGDAKT